VFRVPVLVLALLLTSPALWSAFVAGTMGVQTALIRFLIAMPIAAIMVMAFNAVVESYRTQAPRVDSPHPAETADLD
jgi:hypothetical protein